MYPEVVEYEHDTLPSTADIISMFTYGGKKSPEYMRRQTCLILVDYNPILLDILTGLIIGAGITISPTDHVAGSLIVCKYYERVLDN